MTDHATYRDEVGAYLLGALSDVDRASFEGHLVDCADCRNEVERLRSGPLSVGEIAKGLPVSRPAVSQHLAVLKEAGLVIDRPVGTRRVYTIDPRGLSALRAWFDQFWDQALASFQDEVQRSIESEKADKEKKR